MAKGKIDKILEENRFPWITLIIMVVISFVVVGLAAWGYSSWRNSAESCCEKYNGTWVDENCYLETDDNGILENYYAINLRKGEECKLVKK